MTQDTPIAADALPEPNSCFADSRRLTGHNRFFAGTGVVLEALGPTAQARDAHERWRAAITSMRHAMGWPQTEAIVRAHSGGTLLVFAAPVDLLFTATEINEWAWEQASGLFDGDAGAKVNPPFDQLHLPGNDFAAMAALFTARAQAEINPSLSALRAEAERRHLPILVDDAEVSVGAGAGSKSWPLSALPSIDEIPWASLHDIPVALVTGSNGKTTTVRLLAALIDAADAKYRGKVGYSSTEGIVIGAERAGEGDFSGPAGARGVLRDTRVAAAVLETARGGILRRGLAVDRADVGIITNISADHFGEYGIDSLDDLAGVKMTVSHALGNEGTLVLNADDPVLMTQAGGLACRLALFAQDNNHPALAALREHGGLTCGVVDNELSLFHGGTTTLLGDIRSMPLTMNGAATYNIGNICAAVLAAAALNVSPAVIAAELKRFGSSRHDNPGRLNRWQLADISVIVDYAHNPDGLRLLLAGAQSIQTASTTRGRVGLLLGQAGNRDDVAIMGLARSAAQAQPPLDLVVLKEIPAMLRGRALGEVPKILKDALLAAGYPAEKIESEPDEVQAACRLLQWARAGDVLVLPVHQSASRECIADLLDTLQRNQWRSGTPFNLPD
ncbi:MAG: Mur ligase family protein [Betaproteobacteria bacterium]